MFGFWRVRLFILGIVLVVLACVGAYWGVLYMIRDSASAPFRSHLAQYLQPANGPAKTAPLQGKVVVIDRAKNDVDWVQFDLPNDLRADKPEEVGAVVLLDYGRIPGNLVYGSQSLPSYIQTCKITVVDQASRIVIGETTVRGGEPPSSIDEHASEGVGSKPATEIVDYLKGLPRR